MDRAQLPEGIEPKVGVRLKLSTVEGNVRSVSVTDVTEDAVTVDGNHSLAGKTLNFEIHLERVF